MGVKGDFRRDEQRTGGAKDFASRQLHDRSPIIGFAYGPWPTLVDEQSLEKRYLCASFR
jgi:hypothetical protein